MKQIIVGCDIIFKIYSKIIHNMLICLLLLGM